MMIHACHPSKMSNIMSTVIYTHINTHTHRHIYTYTHTYIPGKCLPLRVRLIYAHLPASDVGRSDQQRACMHVCMYVCMHACMHIFAA